MANRSLKLSLWERHHVVFCFFSPRIKVPERGKCWQFLCDAYGSKARRCHVSAAMVGDWQGSNGGKSSENGGSNLAEKPRFVVRCDSLAFTVVSGFLPSLSTWKTAIFHPQKKIILILQVLGASRLRNAGAGVLEYPPKISLAASLRLWLAIAVMKTKLNPADLYHTDPVKACRLALRRTAHLPENARMESINTLLETCGVEAINGEWQNGYWCDSYAVTVIQVRGDWSGASSRFIVSTVGDWIERMVCPESPRLNP